jgi:hypothetical protein
VLEGRHKKGKYIPKEKSVSYFLFIKNQFGDKVTKKNANMQKKE